MCDNFDDIDYVSLKVIEKNILSRSTRQAKETKEELNRVLNRVENIYGEFEKPPLYPIEFSPINSFITNDKSGRTDDSASVEIVKDVFALEQLLGSKQTRQKYVQQVTVFIVGYSRVASDRLRLMQEVNQFFLNSDDMFDSFFEREEKILSKTTETEDTENNEQFYKMPDYHEENYTVPELAENVKQAVESCQVLTNRLAELNSDMVDCLYKYAQNKAVNKGKKKLEKSLEDAISETAKINEKLAQALKAISDKDSKIENLIKQIEVKSKEVQKFKTAAESVKKSTMESDKLREQITALDEKILSLQSELAQSQLKIEQTKTLDAAQRASAEESALEFQEKCKQLEKMLEQQKIDFEEAKRGIKRQHASELKQIQSENEQQMQQMKELHQQEIQQLKSSEFDENAIALQWSEPEDDYRKQGHQDSEGTLSKNNSQSPSEKKKPTSSNGTHSRSGSVKLDSRQRTNVGSEPSEKDVMVFSDAPNLDDEQFWSSIPRHHLLGRFAQYRQLSMASLSNLLDDIDNLRITNTRQIHSLKSQHQIHKRRWDQDREMLIEALRSTEDDKKEVQSYADLAMQEVENLISILKLPEKDSSASDRKQSGNKKELGLLEQVEQLKEYLEQNENSQISIPRLTTLIELHRNTKQKNIKASETQTENEKLLSKCNNRTVPELDENKDILFPDEIDEEVGTRSVAVSASPTLVRIAFYNRENSLNEATPEKKGVTAKDLEVPSGMVDIEDRTGLNLIQHPIVKDYLHTYDHILTFKEQFLALLQDMDKSEVPDVVNLRQLNVISIRSRYRIIPQIEEMGNSIDKILQFSIRIIERQLINTRKFDSKTPKETKHQNISPKKAKPPTTQGKSPHSVQVGFLQENCRELKKSVKHFQQSYQSKFSLLINIISKLRQLVNVLNKQYTEKISEIEESKTRSANSDNEMSNSNIMEVPFQQPLSLDSVSIFFNRRNSERNVGRMQRAILFNEFPKGLYQEAIEKMSNYIEIPAKQLYVLVRKYLYNDAMKRIAEAVRKNHSFTADTFKILDKMEINIKKKQDRYRDIQVYLSKQRILRAKELLDTFERIENESSIFMIKPTLSMRSKEFIDQFIIEKNLVTETDQLKRKLSERFQFSKQHKIQSQDRTYSPSPSNSAMWNPSYSIDQTGYEQSNFDSRLAEIDTNRMLLPLNNVSVPYSKMGLSGSETYLPPHVAVRSYIAVAHPIVVNTEPNYHISASAGGSPIKIEISSKPRITCDLSKHIPLPPIIPLEVLDTDIVSSLPNKSDMITSKENSSEALCYTN